MASIITPGRTATYGQIPLLGLTGWGQHPVHPRWGLVAAFTFDTEPFAKCAINAMQIEAICSGIPGGQHLLSKQDSVLRRRYWNGYGLRKCMLYPQAQSGLIFLFQPAMFHANHGE